MGRCLQYKFPCGCEVWKGLDCNSKSYIEYIEDSCEVTDLRTQLAKTQAELDKANATLEDFAPYIRAKGTPDKEIIADLLVQLAEAQAELDEDDKEELYAMRGAMIKSSSAMKIAVRKINELRKELAEAVAENERLMIGRP